MLDLEENYNHNKCKTMEGEKADEVTSQKICEIEKFQGYNVTDQEDTR